MRTDLFFIKNWKNLQSVLVPKYSKEQEVIFELHPCFGWGMLIHGKTESGEEITIFLKEKQISVLVKEKIGAPDLFAIPTEWWSSFIKEVVKPFEELLNQQVNWENFYFEKISFQNVSRFYWLKQDQRLDLEIFCVQYSYESISSIIAEWSEDRNEKMSALSSSVPLWVSFGMLLISEKELKGIEVGDSVVIKVHPICDESIQKAWLFWGEPIAVVTWHEEEKNLKVIDMDEQKAFHNYQQEAMFKTTDLVSINAIIGEACLNFEQLKNLNTGIEIKEGVKLYEKVLLLANGVAFAQGDLVEIDGDWMVYITKKFESNGAIDMQSDLEVTLLAPNMDDEQKANGEEVDKFDSQNDLQENSLSYAPFVSDKTSDDAFDQVNEPPEAIQEDVANNGISQ